MGVIVIAEAGVNHNGDIEIAKKLIDVAAGAGADYVKFQTFTADSLVTVNADKASYQKINTRSNESQYAMLKKLELTGDMHRSLMRHCMERGISFLSTGFDIPSVKFLVEMGVDFIKVPSGEITNLPYLQFVGSQGLPVLLSTGMSTLEEVGDAVDALFGAGLSRNQLMLLHCTSEYPAPFDAVNLNAMLVMRDRFEVKVGYSDHTSGITISMAAVALGATIIEKHFTLDKGMEGPDHKASLSPGELRDLIRGIREIECAVGNGTKFPTRSEMENAKVVRKSLVASKYIAAGDIFSEDNLTTKRPGTGISPMKINQIIGTVSLRSYEIDELIVL